MDNVSSQVSGSSSVLAADWNTYVRDNFDDIKSGHVVVADATARGALGVVAAGTMVFEASTSKLWVYTTAWVELGNFTQNTAVSSGGGPFSPFFSPVGMVSPFASATAPAGWLICDGSVLNSTTTPAYTALFSVIGTSFGGSGAAAFNLPNLLGRSVVGAGAAGAQNGVAGSGALTGGTALTARALGAFFGDERTELHTHTMANHTHTYSGGTGGQSTDHSHGGTTGGESGHTHTFNGVTGTAATGTGTGIIKQGGSYATAGAAGTHTHAFSTGGVSVDHSHAFSGTTNGPNTNTSDPQFAGLQANFMPSLGLTYIIKY